MLLQGGLIKHLALPSRSSTCSDRITIITSFRPRATHIYDSSFMSNIRVYSDLPVLYLQWLSYRLQRLLPNLQRLQDKRRFLVTYDEQDLLDEEREMYVLKEYAKRTLRQMVAPGVVEALVGRFGMTVFYTLRDDYVSGKLFEGKERKVCQRCNIGGAMVDKRHMAICPGGRKWRPESPLWEDLEDTRMALQNWGGVEMETRIRELQVKDVMVKWRKEGREWGIADEMAVQGLGEYLLEFLEMYGVEF